MRPGRRAAGEHRPHPVADAGIGLEQFQYLPEYDAYYHTHGDTNYLHNIYVAAGERTGNTLRLYYTQTGGWSCVTLEEQSDGSYWFVSNQPAEKPAIPTVYPEGEPVLTISLADLTPNEPEPVTVTHRQNDCAERGYGIRITTRGGEEHSFRPYRSTDGNIYAARILSSAVGPDGMLVWDVETFFTYGGHRCGSPVPGELLPLRPDRRGGLL